MLSKKIRLRRLLTILTGWWGAATDDGSCKLDWLCCCCCCSCEFCAMRPGWGAGRLCWRAGAVGAIWWDEAAAAALFVDDEVVCRNHGSALLFDDGCEKPRWWPTTTTLWPPWILIEGAWLFITFKNDLCCCTSKIHWWTSIDYNFYLCLSISVVIWKYEWINTNEDEKYNLFLILIWNLNLKKV